MPVVPIRLLRYGQAPRSEMRNSTVCAIGKTRVRSIGSFICSDIDAAVCKGSEHKRVTLAAKDALLQVFKALYRALQKAFAVRAGVHGRGAGSRRFTFCLVHLQLWWELPWLVQTNRWGNGINPWVRENVKVEDLQGGRNSYRHL